MNSTHRVFRSVSRFAGARMLAVLLLLVLVALLAACQPIVAPPAPAPSADGGSAASTEDSPPAATVEGTTEATADQPTAGLAPDPESLDLPAAPKLDPDACRALLAYAPDFARVNDYEAVRTLLDTVIACDLPADTRAGLYLFRSEADAKLGDFDAAIGDYIEALDLDLSAGDQAMAQNNICWYYALTGRGEAALPFCEEAIAAEPSPSYLDSRGLAYALTGNTEAAIADFSAAVDAWSTEANPALAATLTQRTLWLDALRAGADPITDEVLADLRAESLAPAAPVLLSAVSADASANFLRGRQHHIYDQARPALDAYSTAVEIDPEYTLAYYYRGLLLAQQRRWSDALADFRKVNELDPEQPYAHQLAGRMYSQTERYRQAAQAFSEAIQIDPSVAEFYVDRAGAYMELSEGELAVADVDAALELAPGQADLYFMRGAINRLLGNRGQAIADLEHALELGLPPGLQADAEAALIGLRDGFY